MTFAIYYICVRILHQMTGHTGLMWFELFIGTMVWFLHLMYHDNEN